MTEPDHRTPEQRTHCPHCNRPNPVVENGKATCWWCQHTWAWSENLSPTKRPTWEWDEVIGWKLVRTPPESNDEP